MPVQPYLFAVSIELMEVAHADASRLLRPLLVSQEFHYNEDSLSADQLFCVSENFAPKIQKSSSQLSECCTFPCNII
jgi:hypothetical protein